MPSDEYTVYSNGVPRILLIKMNREEREKKKQQNEKSFIFNGATRIR